MVHFSEVVLTTSLVDRFNGKELNMVAVLSLFRVPLLFGYPSALQQAIQGCRNRTGLAGHLPCAQRRTVTPLRPDSSARAAQVHPLPNKSTIIPGIQKLALCCGYLHDPVAILYDEPLTGLDPHGIRVLKDSITQRARRGAAVIVSSHLLAMVEDICTHMLVLQSGRQRFLGPVDELKSTFADDGAGATLEEVFFLATEA